MRDRSKKPLKVLPTTTKIDPSRTVTLRRQFAAEMARRFNRLRLELVRLVVDEDAFGLGLSDGSIAQIMRFPTQKRLIVSNVFCPTGEGGGIDPTCSPTRMYRGVGEGADTTTGFEWFSETEALALRYADHRGGSVKAADVSISKPINIGNSHQVLTPSSFVAKALDQTDVKSIDMSKAKEARRNFIKHFGDKPMEVIDYWSNRQAKEAVRELLESFGYDSITMVEGGEQTVASLRPSKVKYVSNVVTSNQRFAYQSTPDKLKSFTDWLHAKIKADVLSDTEVLTKYIEQGYSKGVSRGYDDANRPSMSKSLTNPQEMAGYQGGKQQFLRNLYSRTPSIETLRLLKSRTLTDLEGVTQQMATVMIRVMSDGLVKGKTPSQIAVDLSSTVKSIGIKRAEAIAQTEIVRAHAEGQLSAMKESGVSEVTASVEWAVTTVNGQPDNKVCPMCLPLDGIVMTIAEATGLIPRHVRCRCAWVPSFLGDRNTQKRQKRQIQRSIRKSLKAEPTSDSINNPWVGSDTDIAPRR